MASLMLAFSVVPLLLLGVAIYEYTKATTLSLPVSTAITVSAIILPILSFLNTIYYATQSSSTRNSRQQLLPPALQILQTIITTVLGTAFFTDIIPSTTRQCLLATRWQQLWTAHDATTIRRIQDTLECCGLNSVKDRAWPFPNKGNPQPGCAAQFSRTDPCVRPWTQALKTTAAVEFGVVVAVGILQLVGVLLVNYFASRGRGSSGSIGWVKSVIRRLTGGEDDHLDGSTRPLLEDVSDIDGDGQPRSSQVNGVEEGRRGGLARGTNGYSGTHDGPTRVRLQPSHLESSPWDGDEDSEA